MKPDRVKLTGWEWEPVPTEYSATSRKIPLLLSCPRKSCMWMLTLGAERSAQRYGTILIDLERHVPIDLLYDCRPDILEASLKGHLVRGGDHP